MQMLEPMLVPEGDLGSVGWGAWPSKLAGLVVRLAGLLHVAERAPQSGRSIGGSVDANCVRRAVHIGEWLMGHAEAAFGLMRADPAAKAAQRVLQALARHNEPEITTRDIQRAVRGRSDLEKRDALDAPLRLLEQHGYLRRLLDGEKKVGRRSEWWQVHPSVLVARGQNGQNPVSVHSVHSVQPAVAPGGNERVLDLGPAAGGAA